MQPDPHAVDFAHVLAALKSGAAYAIRRAGWNGAGLMVKLHRPDAGDRMTLPYLFIEYPPTAKTTPGARCPWLASQTDILADDWYVVTALEG
jgi:hypothetical protein